MHLETWHLMLISQNTQVPSTVNAIQINQADNEHGFRLASLAYEPDFCVVSSLQQTPHLLLSLYMYRQVLCCFKSAIMHDNSISVYRKGCPMSAAYRKVYHNLEINLVQNFHLKLLW